MSRELKDIELKEISLVDKPANKKDSYFSNQEKIKCIMKMILWICSMR